ncbi:VCBS domain-containing protein, partial [Vibrio crassostreae]
MRYIILKNPTELSNTNTILWVMSPSGNILPISKGVVLPAGTVIGISQEVSSEYFIDTSLYIAPSKSARSFMSDNIEDNFNDNMDEDIIKNTLSRLHSDTGDYRFDAHFLEYVDVTDLSFLSNDNETLTEEIEGEELGEIEPDESTNAAPTLIANDNTFTEDELGTGTGINIDAATSTLLYGAADIDDVDATLVIGSINGATVNVGAAVVVTLAYTDIDGNVQTQDVNLTVNADGSYSLDAVDLDALPDGVSATGTFMYQVEDDEGALSNTVTSTLEITGTNDAPVLNVANNGFTEDMVEGGINMPANASNLLTAASDVDGAAGTLQIGTVNGDAA